MGDLLSNDPARQGYTDISVREFLEQADRYGWPFWRGLAIGFASACAFGYVALSGVLTSAG
jgi:hypothetical protein